MKNKKKHLTKISLISILLMMYITENHTDNIIVEIFYALATITIIFNLIASIRSFKRE
ncbi:hypothetical protein [Pediococcus claussenii]|nr:hypothetical protein [Pediococcus claussenii]KRN20843.1 hypothetical protein IV79_GL000064 [Pediococcus claussenii]